jgi:hypothetical protein
MKSEELSVAVERSGIANLSDLLDPENVAPFHLAENRLFARKFLETPGPRWEVSRAEVDAELRSMGHDPADFAEELSERFPKGCLCHTAA